MLLCYGFLGRLSNLSSEPSWLLLWGRFQTQLAGPGLAYLWDHMVAGRSIMPGAGMAEMASAASHSLLREAVPGQALCLTGASIPSPGILSTQAGTLMDCSVRAAEGAVELSTVSAKGTGEPLNRIKYKLVFTYLAIHDLHAAHAVA